jgi:hypothetical protein
MTKQPTTGLAPGHWWVAGADGALRIMHVDGDERDETAQIARDFHGRAFSVAWRRRQGFVFKAMVAEMEEGR